MTGPTPILRTEMVALGDTAIFVRQRGDGTPALFLHAGLLDSTLWLDQIAGLSDLRRCIAPDLRGFGRSEPSVADRLDVDCFVGDIVALLDRLGIDEPADVVGTSLGAKIGAVLAVRHPDRVRSLALISGLIGSKLDAAYRRYQAETARLVVIEGKDVLFRRFNEYIFGPTASLRARARYKEMLLGTRTEMFVALLTNWIDENDDDLLPQILTPTLILTGADDAIVRGEAIAAMLGKLQNGRSILVPNAGRLLSLEAPEAVNRALRDFWTS